jgi:hypothetical protein
MQTEREWCVNAAAATQHAILQERIFIFTSERTFYMSALLRFQTFLIEHTMHHRRLLLVVGTWACTRCSARTRLSRMISTSSTRSGATFPIRSWPTRRKMQRRRCENQSFCLSTFHLNVIVLPRQARDTQKESTHKRRLPFMHRRCGRKCRGRPARWYVRVAAAAVGGARRRRRARKARRRRPKRARKASEAAARTAEGVIYWSSSLSHTLSRKHTHCHTRTQAWLSRPRRQRQILSRRFVVWCRQ